MNRLSDSEFTIMQEIWSRSGPVTAGGLVEAFSERRGWKIQTVSTFLTRLSTRMSPGGHGGQNLTAAVMRPTPAGKTTSGEHRHVQISRWQPAPQPEIEELRRWLDGEETK
ncbi:MAG: BlaI/MecI/CopY family transcriptional regulator [Anaerotruncus massiliensis (ex Togo et al. 2019)]